MRFLAIAALLLSVTSAAADISAARNFYQYSQNVLTSGQPSADLLKDAGDDGIKVVISVVPKSESVYIPEEGEILAAQGIEYIHIPVTWRAPEDAQFDAFMAAMEKVGSRKVLVHCWANARASALVTAHRVLSAPETEVEEFERLKSVWKEVAGYNLDSDRLWQGYLNKNIDRLK